jgi:hypothetical protein
MDTIMVAIEEVGVVVVQIDAVIDAVAHAQVVDHDQEAVRQVAHHQAEAVARHQVDQGLAQRVALGVAEDVALVVEGIALAEAMVVDTAAVANKAPKKGYL